MAFDNAALVCVSDATLRLMIHKARDPRAPKEVGGHPGDQVGIRLWLARGAAGWKPELVREFLLECQRYQDSLLQTACADSLAGKYGKWNPY